MQVIEIGVIRGMRPETECFEVSPKEFRPGVYFLIDSDSIVYVGSSADPANRVYQHKLQGKVFTNAMMVHIRGNKRRRLAVERRMIKSLQPKYNVNCRETADEVLLRRKSGISKSEALAIKLRHAMHLSLLRRIRLDARKERNLGQQK